MGASSRKLYTVTELSRELDIRRDAVRRFIVDLRPVPNEEHNDDFDRYYLADVVKYLIAESIEKSGNASRIDEFRERAEEQRVIKMELQNQIARGEVVSKAEFIEKESNRASMLARALQAIPMKVRRMYSDAPPELLSAMSDEIARAQNTYVNSL